MKRLKNILVAVRILNVLVVCLYVYFSFSVLPPFSGYYAFIAATALSLVAGNILNDCYDTATDHINKPGRPALIKLYGIKTTRYIYGGLIAASLLLALYTRSATAVLTVLGAHLLLAFYARYGKYSGIGGNILVAFLSALSIFAPFLLVAAERPLPLARALLFSKEVQPLLACTLLAFFFSLLREWVKDLEDIEGDRAAGFKTGVIRTGEKQAVQIARLWSLLYLCVLGLTAWQAGSAATRAWLLLYLPVPVILCAGNKKAYFRKASGWLKVVFLSGILAYFYL